MGKRLMVATLVALAGLAACGGDDRPLVPIVPLVSGPATVTMSEDRTALVFARGDRTLLTFHAGSFQAATVDRLDSGDSFDPYWLFVDSPPEPPAGLSWHARAAGDPMRVVASSESELFFRVEADGADIGVTFNATDSGCFTVTLQATADGAQPVAYFRLRPDADATEGFYGLGEWPDAVEHRGTLRPMQMEVDLRSESSNNENHVPVPLLVGTRGWGVFVESDRPGVFDVARETPRLVDITYGTGAASEFGLKTHLFSADAPLDVLAHYHDVAGYPGLPAPWAYGPLLWRNEHRDQAQVLDDITQIRSRKLAVSGIWFDRPYATGVNTFDFSPTKFPQPQTMLQALHDAGFRYAVWHVPYAAPAGVDDAAPTENAYVASNGFFPPQSGVVLNPWSKPLDLTNPAAYAWWTQNLRRYTDAFGSGGLGVEGFKLDYAEDIVLGLNGRRTPWRFADGSDEGTMHRGYTLLYHQIYRDVLPAENGLLLTRTGRWGDQVRGMIVWPGDLDASLAHWGDDRAGESTFAVGGLPTSLSFGIGLSASGFPFYASDTGGYRDSPPNRETWIRWVEANAVWSAMQIGDASSQQPWEFNAQNGRDQAALDIYARYTLLHLRLFPYVWTYAKAIASTGRPIVRPFGLAYPDTNAHPNDEYLLGDDLLVAPVITAGATTRTLRLPPGDWIDWWDGSVHTGIDVTVPAPIDTLPLFIRRGAIIPMLRPDIETLAPVAANSTVQSFANNAGHLYVRVVPSETPSTFTTYDGTQLSQELTADNGLHLGVASSHGVVFEVFPVASPSSVTANDQPLWQRTSHQELDASDDGFFWEAANGGTLWIKLPATTAQIVVM